MKYRVAELNNGKFIIQKKSLFLFWVAVEHILTGDILEFKTEEEASGLVNKWKNQINGEKIKRIVE